MQHPTGGTAKPRKSRREPDPLRFERESGWHGVTDADLASWAIAYPGVDVQQELVRIGEWCRADWAHRRKVLWRKFLVGCLARAQDRASRGSGNNKERKGW